MMYKLEKLLHESMELEDFSAGNYRIALIYKDRFSSFTFLGWLGEGFLSEKIVKKLVFSTKK